METTDDAVKVFAEMLPEIALRSQSSKQAVFHQLALCYDTCHQAVVFEDPVESLATLRRAAVPLGKVQLSAGLVAREPASPACRAAVDAFDEPRFLHQVRTRQVTGQVIGVDDLPQADRLPTDAPWRIHYHVPIHRELAEDSPLSTTRPFLEAFIKALVDEGQPLPHLEVETYTWSVLPASERPSGDAGLCTGIAEELAWARGALT
jgi:hypothetical protein